MAIEQWHAWNSNGRRPDDLAPLMTAFKPLIDHEVHRWSASGLPKLVLEAEAKRHALGAFQTYNPERGSLQTHLMNRLKGMNTFVNTYRADVRMSNERTLLADKLTRAREELKLALGRDATDPELARHIGVGQTTIGKLHRYQTALYSRAEEAGFNQPAREDLTHSQIVADFLVHDLSGPHRLVFEHTTGYGGKPILTPGELAKKLGVSPGRISQLKTDIAEKARGYNRAVDSLLN